jgi:hypothetical protein
MYKKLDCECKHTFEEHNNDTFDARCNGCECGDYDPAGHNPELENIICPQCSLTRMEKTDALYYCMACSFTLFERQVLEMVG